jgi:hypothetical protein
MENAYILKGKEAVPCPDTIEWDKWMATADRKVAREKIGDSEVSTVFLGLNHSFGNGAPLLFESLVFGGKLSDEMDRYTTWDEAVLGHKAMVERVKKAM